MIADQNMSGPDTFIVDLHVHLFPHRMFEAIWSYFERFNWPVQHQQADRIARTLSEHGVRMAVALSYPHKQGVASSLNQFMERAALDHPFLRPFACVHVDDDDLRQSVDRAIDSPRLHGFKFQPLVQAFDVNDPRLDYLYHRCLEADFPIMMHIGSGPMATPHVGFHHFKRLMRRFPELRICVPHMGSTEYDDFLRMMDNHPRMYLDTAMINTQTDVFDNTWRGDPRRLQKHAGRICFGSDWPNVPYPYDEALKSVEQFPFSPEARNAVYGLNALRFLKIAPETA